ncbi:MAG: NAD(P)/FAD-dependent oxidoreductase [Proteobacteria bacterium]|nr:NAD(P)/FAD-dependent oxidoreductase [Pseudomonadota bacterium]
MNQTEIKTTIIGAGVVGLAIAAVLSETETDIFVIEKNDTYGMETSSRNSEVIHAGIYYPKDTLKARLCVEGNRRLYDWCKKKRINHLTCGKMIVATCAEEEEKLNSIRTNAMNNGVANLSFLTSRAIKKLEPDVNAVSALFSPLTGVIDSHQFMQSLYKNAKQNKVQFIFGTRVKGIEAICPGMYKIHVLYPDGEPDSFITRRVINCAGHGADEIASQMGIDIDEKDYRQYFWKGEYFGVETHPFPVKHLIYPVPLANTTGLGVHATIDIRGKLKLGPDATFLDTSPIEYSVNADKRDQFFESVKKFLPFIQKESLYPEMAGVRPKRQKPGDPVKDFMINEESDKGLPGIVNLIGIESPGLTSSLAIADHVVQLIRARRY